MSPADSDPARDLDETEQRIVARLRAEAMGEERPATNKMLADALSPTPEGDVLTADDVGRQLRSIYKKLGLRNLTEAERHVVIVLCRPLVKGTSEKLATNPKIADVLVTTSGTVTQHLTDIYRKFEFAELADKKPQLWKRILKSGLLKEPDDDALLTPTGDGADEDDVRTPTHKVAVRALRAVSVVRGTDREPPESAAAAEPPESAAAAEPPESAAAAEPPSAGASSTELASGGTLRNPIVVIAASVAVVLAAVLAVVFIASESPPPEGPTAPIVPPAPPQNVQGEITYCTGADVVTSEDGRSQHAAAVDAFNEKFGPDVRAKLKQLAEDASEQYAQFSRLQRNRSDDCDVLYSDVIWTADFAQNGWLYDLSPYAEPRLNEFIDAMQQAARFSGRVWGVPKQADAGLLYYNQRKVKDPPLTWQELYAQAAVGKRRLFRYQGLDYEGLTVHFLELAYAAGAKDIVTADGKANVNQPRARDALKFMVDGIRAGAVPRAIVNQTEERSLRAFGRARAHFMRNWPYAYTALQDRNTYPRVAGRVGVTALPAWEGRSPVSVLGGHVLVISAFSDNPGAALKLVDFLSSEEVLKQDATDFSLAPASIDLLQDPEVEDALPVVDLKRAILTAKSRPITPNYEAVSSAIYENVNRALNLQSSPEEALEAAQQDMQQALDSVP